jgi:hypothetical protein
MILETVPVLPSTRQNAHQVINPTSRHYAEAVLSTPSGGNARPSFPESGCSVIGHPVALWRPECQIKQLCGSRGRPPTGLKEHEGQHGRRPVGLPPSRRAGLLRGTAR